VHNNPLRYIDPTGHLATGQVGSLEGMYVVARRPPGADASGCALSGDCSNAVIITGYEVTVNGEGTGIVFTSMAAGQAYIANLQKRNAIAATALSYDGSTAWAYDVKKGNFPAGTNKSNEFVYDVTKQAGAEALTKAIDGTLRAPLDSEWADRNVKITNWRPLGRGETPQPGDVAAYKLPGGGTAYSGHSGIVVAIGRDGTVFTIAAHNFANPRQGRVGPPDTQFVVAAQVGRNVAYRRYTGE